MSEQTAPVPDSATPKHDADCLRRRDEPNRRYLCTCGLTDQEVLWATEPTCASDGCEKPAVVWVGGIARDRGTALCGDCAEEITAYIKEKVASLQASDSARRR